MSFITMKSTTTLLCALLCALSPSAFAAQTAAASAGPGKIAGEKIRPEAAASSHTDLLDASLSQWEIFIGVPHSSVTGLPEGTPQSDDVTKGTPLGLNNDPKKVFTTFTEEGASVLHISGEIYGGLTTKKDYSNYHLEVDFKWGDRKWEPRKNQKRDSGILYHCHGEHGAFWNVWKSCLEYQVQDTDLGDLHKLAGAKAKSRFRTEGNNNFFDPRSPWADCAGSVSASAEPDRPHGEWNHLEIYVLGDSAIHVVNGVVVLAITGALDKNGNPLKSGQIQLQSEGAECFYRNLRLSPIKAFPQDIAAKAGLTIHAEPTVK
jgi:hypothetical protein